MTTSTRVRLAFASATVAAAVTASWSASDADDRDPDPELHSLSHLPYLVELRAPPALLSLMLDERRRTLAVRSARAAYDGSRRRDRTQHLGESDGTKAARRALEAALAEEGEANEAVTRAIDKHYRATSLRLHPDRCGEDSRAEFEALAGARNVLRDEELRGSYVEEMLGVVNNPQLGMLGGLTFAKSSHEAWARRHVPDTAPQPTHSAATKPAAAHKPLQLTGGLINDTPRKPRIYVLLLRDRRIRVGMPPSGDGYAVYQFYQYCTEVIVLANDKRIATVIGVDLEKFASDCAAEISVEIALPENKVWNIQWYAVLRMGEGSPLQRTPKSCEATVDLTSPAQLRRREEIAAADELSRRRAGEVRSTLAQLRGPRQNHKDVESRHWKLHAVMARGRSAEHRLISLLKKDGRDDQAALNSMGGLVALWEALAEALPVQKELQDDAARADKRSALKRFKSHVAGLIERGNAASWLNKVTENELKKLGGEPNRLYQLLVEGRGAQMRYDSLILDSSALSSAAERSDLFTSKQCDALRERSAEAEERAAGEAAKAAEEARKEREAEQEKEEARKRAMAEKAAREAEMAALRAVLERSRRTDNGANASAAGGGGSGGIGAGLDTAFLAPGAVVLMHGLHSAKVLNGSTATVEGRPDGGKCVVRCHADGVLRKVPIANLKEWDGVVEKAVPASTSKPSLAAAPALAQRSNPSASVGGGGCRVWSCSICTFRHEGGLAVSDRCQVCEAPRGTHKEGSWTGVSASSEGLRGRQTQQHTKLQQQRGKLPVAVVAGQPVGKALQQISAAGVKQRATSGAVPASPQRTGNAKRQQHQQQHHQQQQHNQLRCRDGASCRFLRQGPDVCHFRHTPEEIATAAKYAAANAWIERTLRIAPAVVGWVIGRGGIHIKEIMSVSGAKVWIDQESMGPSEFRIVSVKGKRDDVENALGMVRELALNAPYVGSPDMIEEDSDKEATPHLASHKTSAAVKHISRTLATTATAPSITPSSQPSLPHRRPMAQAEPAQVVRPAPMPAVAPSLAPALAPALTPETVPPNLPITVGSVTAIHKGLDNHPPAAPEDDMGTPLQLSPHDLVVEPAHMVTPVTPAISSPTSAPALNATQLAPSASTPVPSAPVGGAPSALLSFLQSHKSCLKGSPSDFLAWLCKSEDIAALADLAEAMQDDEYVREVLQPGDGTVGLKGFKRATFKKAVLAAAKAAAVEDGDSAGVDTMAGDVVAWSGAFEGAGVGAVKQEVVVGGGGNSGSVEIPTELICPIAQVPMTQDPVLAADGHTYERSAIEMWFERQRLEVEAAQRELAADPNSYRAKSIVERGVLSPVTHTMMPSLALMPNVALRTMARDLSECSDVCK